QSRAWRSTSSRSTGPSSPIPRRAKDYSWDSQPFIDGSFRSQVLLKPEETSGDIGFRRSDRDSEHAGHIGVGQLLLISEDGGLAIGFRHPLDRLGESAQGPLAGPRVGRERDSVVLERPMLPLTPSAVPIFETSVSEDRQGPGATTLGVFEGAQVPMDLYPGFLDRFFGVMVLVGKEPERGGTKRRLPAAYEAVKAGGSPGAGPLDQLCI